MRNLAWLAALAATLVLAAGCSQPPPSAPTPSTGPGQGIAVGEPNPNAPGGSGSLVRPGHNESQADGLALAADESVSGIPPGGSVEFTFNATNQGDDAAVDSVCSVPYAFVLRGPDGKAHDLDPPGVRCLAIGHKAFPHGASYGFNRTWNGTYAEGDHWADAPAGRYVLETTFTAQRGDASAAVTVDLPINVLSGRGEG